MLLDPGFEFVNLCTINNKLIQSKYTSTQMFTCDLKKMISTYKVLLQQDGERCEVLAYFENLMNDLLKESYMPDDRSLIPFPPPKRPVFKTEFAQFTFTGSALPIPQVNYPTQD
jgi:hypothetical protein